MPSLSHDIRRAVQIISLSVACLGFLDVGAGSARAAALDDSGFSTPIDLEAEVPTYLIELNDGQLLPEVLVVPAKTRFKLQVVNIGTKPSEFESNQMRLEEVLFMGMDTVLPVTPLDAGEYDYFDEFQPGVMGKLTAKEASE